MKSTGDLNGDGVDFQQAGYTHVVHIDENVLIPAQPNRCPQLLGKVLAAMMFSTALMMLFPIYPVLATLQSSPQTDDSHVVSMNSEAEMLLADVSMSRDQIDTQSTFNSKLTQRKNQSSEPLGSGGVQEELSVGPDPIDSRSTQDFEQPMSSVTSSATSLDALYKIEHQVVEQLRQVLTLADQKLDLIDRSAVDSINVA